MSVWKGLWRGLQIVLTLVLAALLVCNLYLIAAQRLFGVEHPTVFGVTTAVVASGSMSPALEVDDLILIHAQDDYAPGDVITFSSGSNLVTHRIMAKTEAGFVTQGDAKNTSDLERVSLEHVVGKVVWRLPGAGRVLGYLRTPLGLMCLVLLGILLMALYIRPQSSRVGKEDGNGI